MRIDFSVEGEVLVVRELLRIGRFAGDARPAFNAIADDMITFMRKQFDAEGGTGPGGRWKPLQPETLRRKQAAGLDPRILHATLALRNSLTRRGGKHQRLLVTDTFLVFGTDLEYLRYHQKGTATLPKRRVFDFPETLKRSFVKSLQRFIMTGKV